MDDPCSFGRPPISHTGSDNMHDTGFDQPGSYGGDMDNQTLHQSGIGQPPYLLGDPYDGEEKYEGQYHSNDNKDDQEDEEDHDDQSYEPYESEQHYEERDSDHDSDSENRVAKKPLQPYQGLIRNEAHYERMRNQRLETELDKAIRKGQDSDFPETEEGQRELVEQLFNSIKDIDEVLDKPGKNGKPAQAVRRIRDGFYPNKLIEVKCWEILLGCRDAALGVKMVDDSFKSRREKHESFRARFQKIVDGCRISKALCKQIMDPPYIHRLIDAPIAEVQMKHNNKKINAERDIQNEIGRNAVKRGIKLDDLDLIVKSDEVDPNTTAPAKPTVRKTTSTKPSSMKAAPKNTTPKKPARRASSTTQPPSIKRKSPSSTRRVKDEWNDDYDGSDEDYCSPAKRSRRVAKAEPITPRRQYERKARPRRYAFRGVESTGSPIAKALRKSSQRALDRINSGGLDDTTSLPVAEPQVSNELAKMSMLSPTSSGPPVTPGLVNTSEPPSAPGSSVVRDLLDLENTYKDALCDLLHVDRSWSKLYELFQLRAYARAYNNEFTFENWYYPTGIVGNRLIVFEVGYHWEHLAQAIPVFLGIAHARGDLLPDGRPNKNAPYIDGFPPQEDHFMRQALGLRANPFGLYEDIPR